MDTPSSDVAVVVFRRQCIRGAALRICRRRSPSACSRCRRHLSSVMQYTIHRCPVDTLGASVPADGLLRLTVSTPFRRGGHPLTHVEGGAPSASAQAGQQVLLYRPRVGDTGVHTDVLFTKLIERARPRCSGCVVHHVLVGYSSHVVAQDDRRLRRLPASSVDPHLGGVTGAAAPLSLDFEFAAGIG